MFTLRSLARLLLVASTSIDAAALGQSAATPLATGGASPTPRRHALLIGCTTYPNLSADLQLNGPTNDVALTVTLLKERFGFTDDQIVTLLHDKISEQRPTGANIAREFAALGERAEAGDIVFVFLAGHGSQLKNDSPDDPLDEERDGLDEVFLPEDVTQWSLAKPAVGAIRDDQLGAWLDAIRARGATVFFVADTCHAGTLDRGGPSEGSRVRSRWVDPQLLNPPLDASARPARQFNNSNESAGSTGVADTRRRAAGNSLGPLIALYAVSDNATETEEPMPPYERTDGPVHGRLAYTLSDVLMRARRPLTYLELAQQIGWRYQGWDWRDVGMLAGSDASLHAEVLGGKTWRNRSAVTLRRGEFGELSLDVGYLHGATIGSVYIVHSPIGEEGDEAAAGCVVITELTPTTARVETCAYGDVPETSFDQLPAPGRCELAYAAAGSLKLVVRVAAAPFDPPGAGVDLAPTMGLVSQLSARPQSLIALAGAGDAPDAMVLVGSKGVYLRRAADANSIVGDPEAQSAEASDLFGPFPSGRATSSKLARALDAMAKAINIRRLAESGVLMVIGDPNFPVVKLDATVERRSPSAGKFEPVDPRQPLDAYDGDRLRVTITNGSGEPVDLTVLYIDSAFSVVSHLPTAYQSATGTANNRLTPGQSASVTFKINATTLGLEDVIIIATLTTPAAPMQHFVFLEQQGVDRGGDAPGSARSTPLGQLLSTAAFASGNRGGNAAPDMARYAMHRISWRVRKTPPATP